MFDILKIYFNHDWKAVLHRKQRLGIQWAVVREERDSYLKKCLCYNNSNSMYFLLSCIEHPYFLNHLKIYP